MQFKCNLFPTAQHNASISVYSAISPETGFDNPEQISELLGHWAELVRKQQSLLGHGILY